jgi:hypothetical protein
MKIVRSNTDLCISSIEEGEVFEYDNVLYLKTDEVVEGRRTCVRLVDGHVDWFVEELFVYKRVAKVIVE